MALAISSVTPFVARAMGATVLDLHLQPTEGFEERGKGCALRLILFHYYRLVPSSSSSLFTPPKGIDMYNKRESLELKANLSICGAAPCMVFESLEGTCPMPISKFIG